MELISKEVVRRIIDSGRTREQMLGMVECAVAFRHWKSSTESTDSSSESSTDTSDSSSESSTVYVVTQDGYMNGYGSEIYLVGVFTDKKKAEKAASAERAMITEIPLDKKFPLKKDTWGGVGNDFYLGGYIE